MTRFIDDLTVTAPSPKEVDRILAEARTLRARAMRSAATDIWAMLTRATRPAPAPKPTRPARA
jgi:hypothetical protein